MKNLLLPDINENKVEDINIHTAKCDYSHNFMNFDGLQPTIWISGTSLLSLSFSLISGITISSYPSKLSPSHPLN